MRSPAFLPGKIISQGHNSNAGCDLSTLLTCSPLGKEIYNNQPPRIPKPPQLLQGSSLHHRASPRALHQTLISLSLSCTKAGTSLAFHAAQSPESKAFWQNRAPEENVPLSSGAPRFGALGPPQLCEIQPSSPFSCWVKQLGTLLIRQMLLSRRLL